MYITSRHSVPQYRCGGQTGPKGASIGAEIPSSTTITVGGKHMGVWWCGVNCFIRNLAM